MTIDTGAQTNHHETDDFVQILRTVKGNIDVRPMSGLGDALSRPACHSAPMFLMLDDGYASATRPLRVATSWLIGMPTRIAR